MDPRATAAVLAGLCVILGSGGCTGDRAGAGTTSHQPSVKVPGDPAAPLAEHGVRVVTLAFAGDTHFQLNLTPLLERPRNAFGPMADVLGDADVTMLNLESAITERGSPDPKELERPADRYWFRAPARALDVLAGAGVDVVTMANNHGADYGPVGLAGTLRAVERGPLPVIGIGRDRAAAFEPYRVTVDHTRIAFLAADASTLESRRSVWAAARSSPGITAACGSHTRALLAAVRDETARAEVVVVYLHWGTAGHMCPGASQQNLAADLAAAGADVVVGTHAHVQQGAGWLGSTYVDYGLGNFLWYHNREPATGVLRVRIVDGHPVSDRWIPARIPVIGPPVPVNGRSRVDAATRWRALRTCADLAARQRVGGATRGAAALPRLHPSDLPDPSSHDALDPRAPMPRAMV